MIVVYGATGTTGTLIAQELLARGMRVRIAGRDRGRLDALARQLGGHVEVRAASVHEPHELADAFAGARAVVSCAGPFLLVGEPVLRAALDAGAHYLDTTGEQAFMREMVERHDSHTRKAGLAAVPGFAFEVALGDWASSEAARRARALAEEAHGGIPRDSVPRPAGGDRSGGAAPDEPVDEVAIGYAVRGFSPTAGTLESAIASMAQPCSVWREDRWERAAPGSRARRFRFAEPFGDLEAVLFPSGEAVTVPRHVAARRVDTYLAFGSGSPLARACARAAGLFGPLLPALAASPLGAIARARVGSSPPPDEAARAGTLWSVVAEASLRFRRARVSLSGTDPYRTTARIVALGAEALTQRAPRETGVLAPSELCDPAESLAVLVGEGMIAMEES